MKQLLKVSGMLIALFLLVLAAAPAYALAGGGLDTVAAAEFWGEAEEDWAGFSVAGAGDVNGDGYADFLISAIQNDDGPGDDAGAVYLALGSPGGWGLAKNLGQWPLIQYTGEVSQDQAGYSVAGVGDVNGDRYDDFVVGAKGNDAGGSGAGAVYLILGSSNPTGGSLSTAKKYIGEWGGDGAGHSVAGAGDVNGDGYKDFLIGAPGNDDGVGSEAGAAYLILGSSSIPAGSTDLSTVIQYYGETSGERAGGSVAGAGDVNGDGYDDFLVGAQDNNIVGANAGAAYLILGGSGTPSGGGLNSAIQFIGEATSDRAGVSVAGAGDVNGDGYADLLIGAFFNSDVASAAGAVYLILGSMSPAGGTLANAIQYSGEALFNQAGVSVAGAGDVNGDGYADFLVGAIGNSAGGSAAGAAYLVLGSATPTTTSLGTAIRYTGEASNSTGFSVANAGDVNGDGYPDFLVGSYRNSNAAIEAGGAHLIFSDALTLGAAPYQQRSLLSGGGDPPAVNFDQAGVRVDFRTGALTGSDITVSRHLFHPCTLDQTLATPIWTIESPKLETGVSLVSLRFKYSDGHIAGMTEANLKVWTRPAGQPCASWTEVPGAVVNAGQNYISVAGLTSLSQFTIADAPPSPTALTDPSFMTRVADSQPALSLSLLAALALAGGTIHFLRRSSEEE